MPQNPPKSRYCQCPADIMADCTNSTCPCHKQEEPENNLCVGCKKGHQGQEKTNPLCECMCHTDWLNKSKQEAKEKCICHAKADNPKAPFDPACPLNHGVSKEECMAFKMGWEHIHTSPQPSQECKICRKPKIIEELVDGVCFPCFTSPEAQGLEELLNNLNFSEHHDISEKGIVCIKSFLASHTAKVRGEIKKELRTALNLFADKVGWDVNKADVEIERIIESLTPGDK